VEWTYPVLHLLSSNRKQKETTSESPVLVMFPDAATQAESDHSRNRFNKVETLAAD
jgi:hypothetical protein